METMKEPHSERLGRELGESGRRATHKWSRERGPPMRNAANFDGAEKDHPCSLESEGLRRPTPTKCRTQPTSIRVSRDVQTDNLATAVEPPQHEVRDLRVSTMGKQSARLLEIALRPAATTMSHSVRSSPLPPRGSDPGCSVTLLINFALMFPSWPPEIPKRQHPVGRLANDGLLARRWFEGSWPGQLW